MHITAHAGNDIAFALLAEETHRQGSDLLVELVADISHHTRADGDDRGCRQEIGTCLEEGRYAKEQSDEEQGRCLPPSVDEAIHVEVHVVHQHFLDVGPVPGHQAGGGFCIARLEEDLQDGNQGCEGEYIQYCGEDIEYDAQDEVFLVWRNKPPQYV